jgi:Kinetochore complex Sim4 subunit Fta1
MPATGSRSSSPAPPSPQPSKIYNTSFTLTRLTPLYSFNPSRLAYYAREFRDIVRGDVIRGVQIGTPSERAQLALVRTCKWTIENDLINTESFDSVVINVTWDDGSTFIAILMPNFATREKVTLGKRKRGMDEAGHQEFTRLPLLLTRGPQVVTQQLVSYLTTRFDSRASQVSLSGVFLAECLQGYLDRIFQDEPTPAAVEKGIKIMELVYSPPVFENTKVKGALRKITISLNSHDISEFHAR